MQKNNIPVFLMMVSVLMLGRFFENWGKRMESFGTNMKMTVNGKESLEYERYVMRDDDRIELRF